MVLKFGELFSSPEKAQRWAYRIGRYPSSSIRRRPQFQMTSLKLCGQNFDIWHKASTGGIRTLVAKATYTSHRLIMEKVEIANFCSLIGDI